MSTTRPTRGLLAALALAASLAGGAAASPAGAGPLPPQICPAVPKVITSNAATIIGSDCPETIIVGPNTTTVKALGGNDVVRVAKHSGGEDWLFDTYLSVNLGSGNDRYEGGMDQHTWVSGGMGDDVLLHAHPEGFSGSGLGGGAGNDVIVLRAAWHEGSVDGGDGDDLIFDLRRNANIEHNPITGGKGNDTIDATGATRTHPSDAVRIYHDGPGNDTYELRQTPEHGSDEIRKGDDASGFDRAIVDPDDVIDPVIEDVQVAG